MNLRHNLKKLFKSKSFSILSIFLLLLVLSGSTLWHSFENKLFDLLTVVTTPERIDLPIVIVGIDQPSFVELQLQWPWPRSLHAALVDQLKAAGAAVIAFDVIFEDPSQPEEDIAFSTAIKNAGNVVLAADISIQDRALFSQAIRIEPLPLFQQAGAVSGITGISVDQDTVIREVPFAEGSFWQIIVQVWQKTQPQNTVLPQLPPASKIRYLGADHSFTFVSYSQALQWQKRLAKDIFKNKIVIIGLDLPASPQPGRSQSDTFATPYLSFTQWLTPGVEIQATLVANALLGRSIVQTPVYLSWIIILASLMIASRGMRHWHLLKSWLLVLLISITIGIATFVLFDQMDRWFPALAAMLAPLLLYLMQGATAYLQEQRQRRQIKLAFEHYIAPAVVKELINKPDLLKLGGERKKITLMFTDLAGFTSISEKMNPEAVANILNRHLTAMTDIVLEHGGTIDKYIGDAIMAFWGAPLEDEQQAEHACQAAIKMQQRMALLREEFAQEKLPPIYMRLGMHTGVAMVGNMGSSKRFDYSALGDSVNLAARLEGINKLYETEILLSESTASELDEKYQLIPVDKVRVKGKSLPIEIYTVLQKDQSVPDLTTAISAYRNADWDQAEAAWQQLSDNPAISCIVNLHLQRISEFRSNPPADDWDGSVALDKM